MFCSKCGFQTPSQARFCSSCGTATTAPSSFVDASKAPPLAQRSPLATGLIVGGTVLACVIGMVLFAVWQQDHNSGDNQGASRAAEQPARVIEEPVSRAPARVAQMPKPEPKITDYCGYGRDLFLRMMAAHLAGDDHKAERIHAEFQKVLEDEHVSILDKARMGQCFEEIGKASGVLK